MALCPASQATLSVPVFYQSMLGMVSLSRALVSHVKIVSCLSTGSMGCSICILTFLFISRSSRILISLLNIDYNKYLSVSCSLQNAVLISHDCARNTEHKR